MTASCLSASTHPQRSLRSQLAVAVPRQAARFLPTDQALPFVGEDSWTGYEISWLDQQGKPQAGCILLNYGAQTPNIVESKSLKLYLNSFNQTTLPDQHTLLKKKNYGRCCQYCRR
ncbi:MAG: hypothetical protein R3E67_01990 [Pseudomonadales bacterium]